MNLKEQADYSAWNTELTDIAIRDYSFSSSVIGDLVGGHVFFQYYQAGMSAGDAIGEYVLHNM